jgi:hypothetical protein
VSDAASKTCGQCRHLRPFHDEERTAICGGVPPEVKIWGSYERVDPADPTRKSLEPLVGTFRPEVNENDPSCLLFEERGARSMEEVFREAQRSPLCGVLGCGCLRDGDSDYCVEHQEEANGSESPAAMP